MEKRTGRRKERNPDSPQGTKREKFKTTTCGRAKFSSSSTLPSLDFLTFPVSGFQAHNAEVVDCGTHSLRPFRTAWAKRQQVTNGPGLCSQTAASIKRNRKLSRGQSWVHGGDAEINPCFSSGAFFWEQSFNLLNRFFKTIKIEAKLFFGHRVFLSSGGTIVLK